MTALRVATLLAEKHDTSVQLVHVKQHPDSRLPAHADQWLSRAGFKRGDVIVRTGTPWLELLRYAEEHGAQLICIAAHGSSGYQALAAGSNARRLLLRSSVPVVVAPAVTKLPIKETVT